MFFKRLTLRFGIGSFFLLCFAVFIVPLYNPDLFWHLSSAKKAQDLGRLFLDFEAFSFTRYGAYWINYEWLFQKIVLKIYQWGDFRLLVFLGSLLITARLVLFDLYCKKFIKTYPLRFFNLIFAFYFLGNRASVQPELFSLLFLIVFFFLRDAIALTTIPLPQGEGDKGIASTLTPIPLPQGEGDKGIASTLTPIPSPTGRGQGEGLKSTDYLLLAAYCLLFALWSNIHGGFVFALVILGLQIAGQFLELANSCYQRRIDKKEINFSHLSPITPPLASGGVTDRLKTHFCLLALAFAATFVNPYGTAIYKPILLHLKEGSFISELIQEWQPTQFYHQGSWLYWAVFFSSIALLVALSFKKRKFLFSEAAILLAVGFFTGNHVRNIGLFGIVCLPIFWKLLSELGVFETQIVRRRVYFYGWLLAMTCLGGVAVWPDVWQKLEDLWKSPSIPKVYINQDRFPELACQFLERNPELLKLKTMTDWGWGGYAIWRLHDKGLRLFHYGSYILLDLLKESTRVAIEDPLGWETYAKKNNINVQIRGHMDTFWFVDVSKNNNHNKQFVLFSWVDYALKSKEWALVWWDDTALVFVRRSAMSKAWIDQHEYKSRFPVNPYLVDIKRRLKEITLDELSKELERNSREAGLNNRNETLAFLLKHWQAKN